MILSRREDPPCSVARTTSSSVASGRARRWATSCAQYWVPAALSSELPEPDGPPLRVRLLGEDLIAFRDDLRRGGPDPEQLPAPRRQPLLRPQRGRGAALRLPRLEVRRDAASCVDMPSEPAESTFKDEGPRDGLPLRRARRPRSGPTWARARRRRPCPTSSPTCWPAARIQIYQRECNWVQALEGDIDTCHTVFLHLGHVAADDTPPGTWARYALSRSRAALRGGRHGLRRDVRRLPAGRGRQPLLAHRQLPLPVLRDDADRRAGPARSACARGCPMDDEHTLALTISHGAQPQSRTAGRQALSPPETLPNTTDWYGRFRCAANAGNDYQIDRKAQQKTSATPASTRSSCKTRPSPRAWARSTTARRSTWAAAIRW